MSSVATALLPITSSQLSKATGATQARADAWLQPLLEAMAEFDIDNLKRAAAFLAQVGHESGGLRWVAELADGSAYDVGKLALRLGNTPEADGDGQRFKGRGLIQLTGTRNYVLGMMALDLDLLHHPELLTDPVAAARVSGWYWWNNRLNRFADSGDFVGLTKAINGGTNGLADRRERWEAGKKALGVAA